MSEIQSIAQNNYILATQQEVSHDNTLSGNGTVDSPLSVVPGYNETVLWSGNPSTSNIILSESVANFEYIRVFGKWVYNLTEDSGRGITITADELIPTSAVSFTLCGIGVETLDTPTKIYLTSVDYRLNGTTLIRRQGIRMRNDSQNVSITDTIEAIKVVGINRIANN